MDSERLHEFMVQVEKETIGRFREVESLFDARDFRLVKSGDWYKVVFTSDLGYMPSWRYEPMTRFSFSRKAWECKIGAAVFFTSACPFFEFVCELRGYTLAGTVSRDCFILDAGPWNGISGMYFASAADRGRVIFLEPEKTSADFVTSDVQKNAFTNCEVVQKALYSHSGEIGFHCRDGGKSSVCEDGGVPVESLSLHDLESRYAPQGIDFFKLDIEGAEVEIADDLARYICSRPQSWAAVASYHDIGGVHSSKLLEDCFAKYPDLVFRTAYPYHETTFVAHRENVVVARSISGITPLAVGWGAIRSNLKRQGLSPEIKNRN